jgi:DNA-binding MarR family transcriptional regulator
MVFPGDEMGSPRREWIARALRDLTLRNILVPARPHCEAWKNARSQDQAQILAKLAFLRPNRLPFWDEAESDLVFRIDLAKKSNPFRPRLCSDHSQNSRAVGCPTAKLNGAVQKLNTCCDDQCACDILEIWGVSASFETGEIAVVGWVGFTRARSLPMVSLRQEIAQQQPFSSIEEEALLNVMRTADVLHRIFHRKARDWGVTSTQYNVLRILRGAQPDGLTCAAIGERMITADPDITRLLRRLKALKLIRQRRDRQDRRAVWTQISEVGLELLQAMDPMILKAPLELLGHMSRAELTELIRLLELARRGQDEKSPIECGCDGKPVKPETTP